MHSSLRQYILEVSVSKLALSPKPKFTKPRALPVGPGAIEALELDTDEGSLKATVYSAKRYGAWDDRKYEPRSVDFSGKDDEEDVTSYDLEVNWPDWETILDDFKEDRRTEPDLDESDLLDTLLRDEDVEVHCNCPSFHWWGVKARLQPAGTAVDNRLHPFGTKRPREKYNQVTTPNPLCKHLWTLVRDAIYGNTRIFLLSEIKDQLGKRLGI